MGGSDYQSSIKARQTRRQAWTECDRDRRETRRSPAGIKGARRSSPQEGSGRGDGPGFLRRSEPRHARSGAGGQAVLETKRRALGDSAEGLGRDNGGGSPGGREKRGARRRKGGELLGDTHGGEIRHPTA